jgi:hypothetical protein
MVSPKKPQRHKISTQRPTCVLRTVAPVYPAHRRRARLVAPPASSNSENASSSARVNSPRIIDFHFSNSETDAVRDAAQNRMPIARHKSRRGFATIRALETVILRRPTGAAPAPIRRKGSAR